MKSILVTDQIYNLLKADADSKDELVDVIACARIMSAYDHEDMANRNAEDSEMKLACLEASFEPKH